MPRGQQEREAGYLLFISQRPGDLIYISHLLPHAVLNSDTGSPTIRSGWDAATVTNQKVNQIIPQRLDEYTFGACRGKWREVFRKRMLIRITRMRVFSFNRPPGK